MSQRIATLSHKPSNNAAMRACLVLAATCLPSTLQAQQPPYDNPPAVTPPYYRVRFEALPSEPGDEAREQQAVELIYAVSYTLWVPPNVERLRGVVVHQHGCGEGSCKSGQTGAWDLHWQALARKHQCALLAPSYEQPESADCQMWCDPRNGSSVAFQRGLTDLAVHCDHPELADVPWVLWGHSGGGHWAGGMLLGHPDRVVAAWLRSGVPLLEPGDHKNIRHHELSEEALQVPIMCNLGAKEGFSDQEGRFASVWPSNQKFFAAVRRRGGLIAVAVDPLTSHECGNQRYLAIPWLDACMTARLPAQNGEPLRPFDASQAWLAPLPTPTEPAVAAVPAGDFQGELQNSVWLPDGEIAWAWTQYMSDTEVADDSLPPAPTQPRVEGRLLMWDAVADLESGISHFVIELDGQVLAELPEKPKNPYGRPLFQGLQYSDTPDQTLVKTQFPIPAGKPTDVERYRIRTVNTAGLVSE